MTEEEARMLGKAIREEAALVALPIKDEQERRMLCLNAAIGTKHVAFALKNDTTVEECAEDVVKTAAIYYQFVTGGTE